MTVPVLTGRDGGTAASARRKRREALGFSQESYADEIGMHRTYYSAIERGEKNLQLDTLQRVCEGLQTSIWEVFKEAEAGLDRPAFCRHPQAIIHGNSRGVYEQQAVHG